MANKQPGSVVKRLLSQSDLVMAMAVVGIILILVIPTSPALLDILISFNISFALVIMLTTLYISRPLELSVFPGLLLVVTLLRLALNVASTRLILGDAYAGDVIYAFGNFVVKGNYVVGLIIFLILVIIQFVVITKGATRISEVAARFTLDAMPGKQMAIDADLNAGLIDERDALNRREVITKEADFYGAMDGASKFVRGDAIAGIIITLINIIGGFIIGALQRGMSMTEALSTYTLLTVGDGLVTQIPALIVSTSAGILVTRAAASSSLGHDLVEQLSFRPRAVLSAAGIMFIFAIMPGLPTVPFGVLGTIIGSFGLVLLRQEKAQKKEEEEEEDVHKPSDEAPPEAQAEDFLRLDTLEIEIGYGLIPLVDAEQGGDLLDRVGMIRRQLAADLGMIVPPIRIRDNIQLKPNQYVVKLKGVQVDSYELMIDHLLAINSGVVDDDIDGFKTTDPAFGLNAKWIIANYKEMAEMKGYTVVEPAAVIATHLTEVVKNHAAEILTRQDVQNLLEVAKKEYPAVVEETIPDIVGLGVLQKVLQNLLMEKIPVKDMQTILETLNDYGPQTKDADLLAEYCRYSMRRIITNMYLNPDGKINVFTLDPNLEKSLADSVNVQQHGLTMIVPPELAEKLIIAVANEAEKIIKTGELPICLVAANLRRALWKFLNSSIRQLAVLSYNEILPDVEVHSVGIVEIENAD
ncbi:MAG: flagellar biosynthesis protein FlhA [candidate division Zixibacteria bacterium]|nr:flagellar biosynthesis protein FlhA [candidate division Zixibacteria bacterium]